MNTKRLLILDDDPGVGQTIGLIASTAGFDVSVQEEPDRFFHLVQEWQPTHIALDLVMPRMDGVEVIAELARNGCSARIIITSGVGSRVLDAAARSAAEHGLNFLGVLAKPFRPANLLRLLNTEEPSTGGVRRAGGDSQFEVTAEELTAAIQSGHLALDYQPKVECASGRVAGFEALVRWRHPRHGLIMPDRFIPFAEESGLIGPLTDEVLEQALAWFTDFHNNPQLRQCPALQAMNLGASTLSVNLSAKGLQEAGLADRLAALCQGYGVDTERLIFEVTETSAMEDPVASLDLLTRLRMKGFQLSIDDFGTGFSSMVQLVRLPFSEIKVDKSFVIRAMSSRESRTITSSIIDLGQSLGLKVTAEGVEDGGTLEFLRDESCDLAQGYHIARPMAAAAIPGWLLNYSSGGD